MMASTYFKSSNFPGFSLTLQKFHSTICDIISPKLCEKEILNVLSVCLFGAVYNQD